ncbi:hypothetical protein COV82_03420 [Candidatus Peregrinibacteria bacterium CG11_big_fil_rev_8_21_14_0_20_46_8]|nr:MAG: hypothetical protein COV82_03420 [Candidatus Peregrinibacteria bacterium CG11_big_fil_rev_8_21_14_0_20_46_8]
MADSNKKDDTTIDLRNAGTKGGATTQDDPASKFEIPDAVKNKYPELIPLILKTESMKDEERQYWFHILPIMTDEQVGKLREILDNEQQELARIDREYEDEINKINDKHMTEWKAFEAKEKREKLLAEESHAEAAEASEEEEILKKLGDA